MELRHSYRRAIISNKRPRTIAAQQAHDTRAKDPKRYATQRDRAEDRNQHLQGK
jgi:hypothetical protein